MYQNMNEKKETLLELLDPPFPLIYKGILPKSTHFQMSKSRLSRECAVCERIYSVFYWKIENIPYRTCICQICAKSANVCQVSLLDLDIGVPVVVRNKLLQQQAEEYKSKARRWYNNRVIEKKIENGEEWTDSTIRDRVRQLDPTLVALAQQYVQADPYLSFKKPLVCQDWLMGNCIYGESCYYSHMLPLPGEISPNASKHGIRGRYLGTLDPNGTNIIEKLIAAHPSIFKKQQKEVDETNGKVDQKNSKKSEKQIISSFNSKQTPVMTLPSDLDQIYSYEEPIGYDFIKSEPPDFPHFVNGKFVH